MDLNIREGHEGYHLQVTCAAPPGYASYQKQEATWTSTGMSASKPPALTRAKQDQMTAKRKSMAMSIAMQPGQQILMNAFMMYMSGNQLNIWSINITSSAVLTPLAGILSIDRTFGKLQQMNDNNPATTKSGSRGNDDMLQMPKIIFIALNLVWLALGLYKMSTMKLLPTTSADWTHRIVWKDMMETTSIPPDNMIL